MYYFHILLFPALLLLIVSGFSEFLCGSPIKLERHTRAVYPWTPSQRRLERAALTRMGKVSHRLGYLFQKAAELFAGWARSSRLTP